MIKNLIMLPAIALILMACLLYIYDLNCGIVPCIGGVLLLLFGLLSGQVKAIGG